MTIRSEDYLVDEGSVTAKLLERFARLQSVYPENIE